MIEIEKSCSVCSGIRIHGKRHFQCNKNDQQTIRYLLLFIPIIIVETETLCII